MILKHLLSRLTQDFGSAKVVTLADITRKIAIISKVRVTKNRTFKEYDEISLNNIDEYGVVYIIADAKEQDGASPTAIKTQSLKYGDLVLNQRTSKMKVGFIDKAQKYKQAIVGNNSMIRVEFEDGQIDTARYVQLYLQLPYVLEYLNTLIVCSKGDGKGNDNKSNRQILSSTQLQALPIPKYVESKQLVLSSDQLK